MLEDRIKEGLFEKLRELHEVIEERDEIEKNLDYTYEEIIQDEDLVDEHIDYLGLCSKEMDLQDEIKALMFDTKYTLLTGLTNNQINELSFYVKSANLEDPILREKIEKDLDIRLLQLREEIKNRESKIKPLHLTINVELRVKYLYRKIIRCFVYGAFEESCVLCRAVAEFIAKEFIKAKKLEHLLPSKERKREEMSILQILTRKSLVPEEITDLYFDIKEKANRILHERDEIAEEGSTLETIGLLQSFIEKFPRT